MTLDQAIHKEKQPPASSSGALFFSNSFKEMNVHGEILYSGFQCTRSFRNLISAWKKLEVRNRFETETSLQSLTSRNSIWLTENA